MAGRRSFGRLVARFCRDQRGNAAMMFGLAVVPLLAGAGLALDSLLAYSVEDQLQKSLDAAGLAAGRTAVPENVEADATSYFNSNFGSGAKLATAKDLKVKVNAAGDELTLSASAVMPTRFMRLFGYDTVQVTAATVIHRETRGMELALVFDNTGSMVDGNKIGGLKTAAHDLSIFFMPTRTRRETCGSPWYPTLPRSMSVPATRHSWPPPIGSTPTRRPTRPTAGTVACWRARHPRTRPTIRPASRALRAISTRTCRRPTGRAGRTIGARPLAADPQVHHLLGQRRLLGRLWPQCRLPDRHHAAGAGEIEDRGGHRCAAAMVSRRHDHQRGPGLGLARAVAALARPVEGAASTLPLDYASPNTDKVLVLLTDGDNQMLVQTYNGNKVSPYTAYQSHTGLGVTSESAAKTELDKRTTAVCTAIKKVGIRLYTVSFGSVPSTGGQALLKSCATRPEYYFHSPDNASLRTAFRSIGGQLSNLRIAR